MPSVSLDQLPNLFILGAAKAGTTSLHAYLAQHPAIYGGTAKEPHFFDDNWAYQRGLAYYAQTFYPDAAGYTWRMDGTPGYFHLPHRVIPRLQATYGSAPLKFIVSLREPVSRAWSHYLHRVALGAEPLSFAEALAAEDARRQTATEWDQYFNDGRYAHQLRAWFSAFPRQQFFILLQEDLQQDAAKVLRQLFAFLEIDADVPIDTNSQHNQSPITNPLAMKILRQRLPIPLGTILSPYIRVRPRDLMRKLVSRLPRKKAAPPAELVQQLRAAYRDDILALSELIDRDLSHWLAEPASALAEQPNENPPRA